jgi:hypothetical protein
VTSFSLRHVALLLLPLAIGGAAKPHEPLRLGLPLQCRFGRDCVIQSYVDDDPGPDALDYLCRGRTYNNHNGTDFRIPSMARQRTGVNVLAVASGRVLRTRDGVPDISVTTRGKATVTGEECGNGLVIDHGDGWESQYCHLARGSVAVHPGQRIKAGQVLGRVGLSGDTEFPHVHLTIRKDGHVVDPFAYGAAPASCGGGRMLWKERLPYQSGQVLIASFATQPVSMAAAQENGAAQAPMPSADSPALIAFVQAIGLQRGDVQRLRITAPDMTVLIDDRAAPLDHDKAQTILNVGRRTPPQGWMHGVYQADYSVRRGDVDVIVRSFRITL